MDNNGQPNDNRATGLEKPVRSRHAPKSSSRSPGIQPFPTTPCLASQYPSIQEAITEGLRNGELIYVLTKLRAIQFDENNVISFFKKVELYFRSNGIINQYTRLLYLISSVPSSVVYLASGGRIATDDSNCYDDLKRAVLNIYRRPIDDFDSDSFTLTEFGGLADLTPDQAHDIVIKLYGPAPMPPLRAAKWKYVFTSLLGDPLKSYLLQNDDGKSLPDIVEMAHEFIKTKSTMTSSDNTLRKDATPRHSAGCRSRHDEDTNTSVAKLIDTVTELMKHKMCQPMHEQVESDRETDIGKIVKAFEMAMKITVNSFKNDNHKSKLNKARTDGFELCWYHGKFGSKANRCVSVGNRCQWEEYRKQWTKTNH